MVNVFSKCSVVVIIPNQQPKTVAEVQVYKWFYADGITSRIHSDQVRVLMMELSINCAKCMVKNNPSQYHIILMIIHDATDLIAH